LLLVTGYLNKEILIKEMRNIGKKAVICAILILVVTGILSVIYLKDHGFGERSAVEKYTFNTNWLGKQNIYVYGTPSLSFLKAVNATGVTFSVYYSGLNDDDKNYLEELHRSGFKVTSNFPTVQERVTDNQSLQESARCVDISGSPLGFFGDQYTMCSGSHAWQEFLKKRIEEHIDGGADAILIDEIGTMENCFCDDSNAAFNAYLSSHYSANQLHKLFGIDDINKFDYRTYLLEKGAKTLWDDPNQKLMEEYFKFLYQSRVSFIHELIQHARDYAGRGILFTGNTYGLHPDHQIYLPYLDFAVFEIPIEAMPEGKMFTLYLLGESLYPSKQFVGFPDIFVLANISEEDWWLWRHWLAEAHACGGSFLIPYNSYTFGGGSYSVSPEKLTVYTDFISSHKEFYDNVSRVSKVAILYDLHSTLTNQAKWRAWEAWNNFLNTGKALQEEHVPFDILYKGDNEFINKSISLNDLKRFSAVIIPGYYDLDVSAELLLQQYAQSGGHVVRLDDVFNKSNLTTKIKATGIDFGLETNAPEDLSILIYKKGDSLLIHFINYDYNYQNHDFVSKNQIELTVTIPEGFDLKGKKLRLISPDADEKTLDYTVQNNKVRFVVPEVHEYSVVVFE